MKKRNLFLPLLMAIVMMALSPTKMWADDVASVAINGNTTNYTSLGDAFTAAQAAVSATVTLLSNASGSITLTTGTVTFDLNGKVLTGYVKTNGCNLTVNDNSTEQTGKISANISYALRYESGTLAVNGGYFEANTYGFWVENSSLANNVITLHGGTFKNMYPYSSSNWSKLGMDGYKLVDVTTGEDVAIPNSYVLMGTVKIVPDTQSGQNNTSTVASVAINGATTTYETIEAAFAAAASGTTTTPATVKLLANCQSTGNGEYYIGVTSGVITLDLNGKRLSSSKGSVLYINGGTLTIDDTSNDGSIAGSLIAIKFNSGKLTVKNGSIMSASSVALDSYQTTSNTSGDIVLRGGIFEGGNSTIRVPSSRWDILDMTGYQFVNATSGGDVAIPTNANTITGAVKVVKANPVSVTINGTTTKYETVETAFAAAASGTTSSPAAIKLLTDYTCPISGQYFIQVTNGVMTLDLNGKTLSGKNNQSVIQIKGGTLTINDSGTGGTLNGALYALDYYSGKLTVNGGIFNGNDLGLYCSNSCENGVSLRGGTFRKVQINVSNSWNTIDLTGYKFVNASTGEDVAIISSNICINETVKVVQDTQSGNGGNGGTSTGNGTELNPRQISSEADYTWLQTEAADANNNSNTYYVQLAADFNYSSDSSKKLTFSAGTWNIDLNGHTITVATEAVKIDGAKVIINDNSTAKTGGISGAHYQSGINRAIIFCSGTLLINGGTYNGASSYAGQSYGGLAITGNYSNVTLHGGTFNVLNAPRNSYLKNITMTGYDFYDGSGSLMTIPEGTNGTPDYYDCLRGVTVAPEKTPVTVGTNNITVAAGSDGSAFKFTPTATNYYSFAFSGEKVVKFGIQNKDNCYDLAGKNNYNTFVKLTAGTAYILETSLDQNETTNNACTLTIATYSAPSMGTSLTEGTAVNVADVPAYSQAVYSFTPTQSGVYSVTYTGNIEFYPQSPDAENEYYYMSTPFDGFYYLKSGTTYRIVGKNTTSSTISSCTLTVALANIPEISTTNPVTISSIGAQDKQMYKFVAQASNTYVFANANGLDMILYSDKLVEINSGKSELSFSATAGNTYYLCVVNKTTSTVTNAEVTVEIPNYVIVGTKYSDDCRAPYHNNYRYSTTITLYKGSEIGRSGVITDIAYNVKSNVSGGFATNEVKIYMMMTDKTDLNSYSDLNSAGFTLVYSGNPTLGTATGWENLVLDTPFNYNDNTKNLLIAVCRKSDSYTSSLKYYYTNDDNYKKRQIEYYLDTDSQFGELSSLSSMISKNNLSTECYYADIRITFPSATYTLEDATAYTVDKSAIVGTLTYKRTFADNDFNCLYVPFDAPVSDFTDCSIYAINMFQQHDTNNDGVVDNVTLEVIKAPADATIKANHPYLIKYDGSSTGTELTFTFNNVTLASAATPEYKCSSMNADYVFQGMYTDATPSASEYYTLVYDSSKGKVVLGTSNNGVGAQRWYMTMQARDSQFGTASSNGGAKSIDIVIEGDEVDGIDEVSSFKSQVSGKFIENGKVVIIRNGKKYNLNGQVIK